MEKNLNVIIASAGESKRFNCKIPKPFLKINFKPILWYSAYAFQKTEIVKNIYIVIAENMLCSAEKIKKRYFKKIDKFKAFIIGGEKRQDSVYNALNFISKNDPAEFVAVHDAARPFITDKLITKIWESAVRYGGAACGIKVIDTIKICDKNNFIKNHLKRNELIAVQTPQIFNFKKLLNSYNKIINKNMSFTDDAEIYGMFYNKVKIIDGSNDIFKITFKNDLRLAKSILRNNKKLWT